MVKYAPPNTKKKRELSRKEYSKNVGIGIREVFGQGNRNRQVIEDSQLSGDWNKMPRNRSTYRKRTTLGD